MVAFTLTMVVTASPWGGAPEQSDAGAGQESRAPDAGDDDADDAGEVTASPVPGVPADAGTWGALFPALEVRGPGLVWGPSLTEVAAAKADAQALSLEDAAGQVVVAQWNSPDAAGAAELVAELNLAGIIVMGGAVESANQVSELTQAIREAGGDRDWGTIVSVDEEGGTVSRLRGVVPGMPGFMAAGAARDKSAVTQAYLHQAADVRSLGFTMDFAPVADVTAGLSDPVIRSRAAGDDPQNVASTVVAATGGYVQGGVVPVIKHFPGHGSVDVDSHYGLPAQTDRVATLEKRDFVPFAQAIDAGAPAVMMGHIAVKEWGDLPASLNPKAYSYLREQLGFTGLAVTDALNMGAIQDEWDSGESAVAALAAGADVVLLPQDPRAARDAIVAAVEAGDLDRARLDDAVARVIVAGRWQAGLDTSVEAGGGYAYDLALAGATVATSECGGSLVGDSVTISGGSDGNRAALTKALEARGVTVGSGGTSIGLTGSDSSAASADVVVALRGPWGLEDAKARTYVGMYGSSGSVMNALADILTGAAPPGGTWPVALDLPVEVCS
ncbi:beta-N-acetylhexosaminidase [Demequina sp. B12]|uniref:glycoside hydrolase family 3 N-terminal domain-containing protein n=1 Tax=Demequina sp. B12 TaxID=2992757 RepID=UPI00237C0FA0|nr:glycoside hydrolase family 3 N-terminal domain-containing protein [Demequina sp. B12]MDE0572482.1 beta-N-acetylhexosaminidase [Demequina sp. B12]